METQPNRPQVPRIACYSTLSSALLRYKPKAGPAPPTLQIRHSPDTKTRFPSYDRCRVRRVLRASPNTRDNPNNPNNFSYEKLRFRYDRVRVCCRRGTPPLTAHPTPTDHFRFFTEIAMKKLATATTGMKWPPSPSPARPSPRSMTLQLTSNERKWAEMARIPLFFSPCSFPAGLPSTRTARECSTMPLKTVTHPSQQKEAQLASLQRHPQSHNRGVRWHPSLRRGTRPRRPRG